MNIKGKLLIFTGPESSGKTTMAEYVHKSYDWPLVIEYARPYLNRVKRPYKKEDLEVIAKGQISQEIKAWNHRNVVCDTDLLTIIIWAKEKYNETFSWMINHWSQLSNRTYFLCKPDIPWVEDSLRENPDDRGRLFLIYKEYLERFNKNYHVISGNLDQRKKQIDNLIKDSIL